MTSFASLPSKKPKSPFLKTKPPLSRPRYETLDLTSSIQDLKAALPDYDAALAFTRQSLQSVSEGDGKTAEIPKPGRTVSKLKLKNIKTILGGPNLTTSETELKPIKLPDGIKQVLPSKAKNVKAKKIPDVNSRIQEIKKELQARKQQLKQARTDYQKPDEFLRQTSASLTALHGKITSKQTLWENEQLGWNGYNYKTDSKPQTKARTETRPENQLLSEMSQKFREALISDFQFPDSHSEPGSKQLGSNSSSDASVSTVSSSGESKPCSNPLKNPVSKKSLKKATSSTCTLRSLLETTPNPSRPQSDRSTSKVPPPPSYAQLKSATELLSRSSETSKFPKALQQNTSHPIILHENIHEPQTDPDPYPIQTLIRNRLQESVTTVDEAATVATRLGTLLTRLSSQSALAAVEEPTKARSLEDTIDLAKQLRELAADMEKQYSTSDAPGRKSGETQTDSSKSTPSTLVPTIKFTKQMSYTDQLVLRKLREIRDQQK